MSWRDGCAPWPTVHAGAAPVAFDFALADDLGRRLDLARARIAEAQVARAAGQRRLAAWAGAHRRAYDEHRRTQDAVVRGADLAVVIARLRRAWDEAAAEQVARNRRAAAACRPVPPP